MTSFSSREPFADTIARRRTQSWHGTAPVTLTRGDLQIDGHRQGRYGGVMVYRPTGDIDFGPKRTHRVWSGGRYAELPDEEWERMGWSITVRQANPTNRVLTRLRAARTNPDGSVNTANITMSEVWMDGATPQELAHALHVLARMELLRQLPARTTDQGGGR